MSNYNNKNNFYNAWKPYPDKSTNSKFYYKNWKKLEVGRWVNRRTGDFLVYGSFYGRRCWIVENPRGIVMAGGSFRSLADEYNYANGNSLSGYWDNRSY